MKIIIDCNIWISWLIGHQASFVRRLLLNPHVDVYMCDALLDEIRDVANRSKIRKNVGKADTVELLHIIKTFCIFADIKIEAHSYIRDPKDLYLLSFAESINADYIVSGDNDLLTLQQHKNTKILKLAEFKEFIS